LKVKLCLLPAKGRTFFLYRLCSVSLLSLIFFSVTQLYAKDISIPAKSQFDPALTAVAKVENSIPKADFSKIFSSYAVVTASALNLRSSPNTKNPPINVLHKGTHLLSLSAPHKKWLKVKLPQRYPGLGSSSTCQILSTCRIALLCRKI